MTEYEALLVGLRLAKKIQVGKVQVYADSQLVVRQVTGEYKVKYPLLKMYNKLVKQLRGEFLQIQLIQIPHEENARVDELS